MRAIRLCVHVATASSLKEMAFSRYSADGRPLRSFLSALLLSTSCLPSTEQLKPRMPLRPRPIWSTLTPLTRLLLRKRLARPSRPRRTTSRSRTTSSPLRTSLFTRFSPNAPLWSELGNTHFESFCISPFADVFGPFSGNSAVKAGTIALSGVHRKLLDLQLDEGVNITPFRTENSDIYLTALQVNVDFLAKSKKGTPTLDLSIYLGSEANELV